MLKKKRMWGKPGIPLLLISATLCVFVRVPTFDRVGWDDDLLVFKNPYLNQGNFPSRFWLEPYEHLYVPLTFTVWSGVARATARPGDMLNPRPFHVVNIFFHAISVLVVFAILRSLTFYAWASFTGALIFAIHPVQVEPVAWITGMKELLSGFFSLVAILFYIEFAIASRDGLDIARLRVYYFIASLTFALALLSKPTSVAVPIVVFALDRWAVRRPTNKIALATIPWAILAAGCVLLAKQAQPDLEMRYVPSVWLRPAIALDAIVFYLGKVAVPMNLGTDYGRTPQYAMQSGAIYISCIPFITGAILAWVILRTKRESIEHRSWLWVKASAGTFLAGMVPVLGLVPFNFQDISTVADRYLYLSMLGPAIALAAIIETRKNVLIAIVCAVGFTILGFIAFLQTLFWQDTLKLFDHAIAVNPRSWVSYDILGSMFVRSGRINEGTALYRQALRINPDFAPAHNDLALALASQGNMREAVRHWREAVRLAPTAQVHHNLASALCTIGQMKEGIAHYRRALELNPEDAQAHDNIARALMKIGSVDQAMAHQQEATRLTKQMRSGNHDSDHGMTEEKER